MAIEGRIFAAVAAGGAIGALLRHLTSVGLGRTEFPFATLAVNVVGSFLLGLYVFHELARGGLDPTARAFFAVGVLGAFTTMSAFSFETVTLYLEGRTMHAALSIALNVVLSILAVMLGRSLALLIAEPT